MTDMKDFDQYKVFKCFICGGLFTREDEVKQFRESGDWVLQISYAHANHFPASSLAPTETRPSIELSHWSKDTPIVELFWAFIMVAIIIVIVYVIVLAIQNHS